MLFAFVACDNSGSNANPAYITYVEATLNSGVVYVEGEKVDPADFTFKGYDVLGNEIATIPSERFSVSNNEALAAGKENVTFTLDGVTVEPVEIEVEALTGLSVDASASSAKYYAVISGKDVAGKDVDTTRDIIKDGIVVTASYAGGTKVLDNEKVSFTNSNDWTAGEKKVTVKLGNVAKTAEYTINVLPNLVRKVTLNTTADYTLYSDVVALSALDYTETPSAEDAKGLYMVAEYESGESVVVAETNVQFQTGMSGTTPTWGQLSQISAGDAETLTVTAKYNLDNGIVGLVKTATSPIIRNVEDSVIDIKFEAATGYIAKGDYTSACTTNPFKITPVMASGSTYSGDPIVYRTPSTTDTDVTDNCYWFTPYDLSEGYTEDDRYSFTVNAIVDGFSDTATIELIVGTATPASDPEDN